MPKLSKMPLQLWPSRNGRDKTSKRHIRTKYNLSPNQYREKWELPEDYPMVSANYRKKRSEIARNTGLGIIHRKFKKADVTGCNAV